jgi:hypothetical protein
MGDRKQARDEEFQRFVIGRWPRLMRTAFLLTGEQHAAEDLVQATLEQVYVAWRRVGAADDPEAYVRRVIGQVATTAQEVTCTWDDGSTTKASRPAPGTGIVGDFEDARARRTVPGPTGSSAWDRREGPTRRWR